MPPCLLNMQSEWGHATLPLKYTTTSSSCIHLFGLLHFRLCGDVYATQREGRRKSSDERIHHLPVGLLYINCFFHMAAQPHNNVSAPPPNKVQACMFGRNGKKDQAEHIAQQRLEKLHIKPQHIFVNGNRYLAPSQPQGPSHQQNDQIGCVFPSLAKRRPQLAWAATDIPHRPGCLASAPRMPKAPPTVRCDATFLQLLPQILDWHINDFLRLIPCEHLCCHGAPG